MASTPKSRCGWPGDDPLMRAYHDAEWGAPQHDDRVLFEFVTLESAQAGLNWKTILNKREGYRQAFAGFDPAAVARFTECDQARLLADAGIVRNRLKIAAAITNAQAFLAIQEAFGSFDAYSWRFVEGAPIQNHWRTLAEIPARSAESDAMSKDMKQRGIKFFGTTICYAHMQAVGMMNDHIMDCFRWREVQAVGK